MSPTDTITLTGLGWLVATEPEACYFCGVNRATTTRTRPDGAVTQCPTCKDCADIIDEQSYNDAQAEEHYQRFVIGGAL